MKKILLSFATKKFRNAQKKLEESAYDKSFDIIISANENDISEDIYAKHNNILSQPRGFGYWWWKSFFIKKCLDSMDDGDVLFYIDSSNLILKNSSEFILESDPDIKLFENKDSNPCNEVWKNNQWTKRDCFTLMNCDSEKYWYGKQVNASYQIYRKSDLTTAFINDFFNYSCNEKIITDSPNITGDNFENFSDHRHDQSILSLLAIKYDICLYPDPSLDQMDHTGNIRSKIFDHCRGRY